MRQPTLQMTGRTCWTPSTASWTAASCCRHRRWEAMSCCARSLAFRGRCCARGRLRRSSCWPRSPKAWRKKVSMAAYSYGFIKWHFHCHFCCFIVIYNPFSSSHRGPPHTPEKVGRPSEAHRTPLRWADTRCAASLPKVPQWLQGRPEQPVHGRRHLYLLRCPLPSHNIRRPAGWVK